MVSFHLLCITSSLKVSKSYSNIIIYNDDIINSIIINTYSIILKYILYLSINLDNFSKNTTYIKIT